MYECPRCNYETLQKCNLIKHFKRKTICEHYNKDISIDVCISMLSLGKLKTNIIKSLKKQNKLI